MNIFKRAKIIFLIVLLGTCLFSCKDDVPDEFSENEYHSYKLFNILDDYPSLYALIESLDQNKVNGLLARAVNHKLPEYILSTRERNTIISDDPMFPMQNTLQQYKSVLKRIIDQDSGDHPEDDAIINYAESFYSLIDDGRKQDFDIGKDLAAFLRAAKNYAADVLTEPDMMALIDKQIKDIDDSNYDTIFDQKQKSKAKATIQCDYPIYIKADGKIETSRAKPAGGKNLGVGNLVNGKVALLTALNEIIHNNVVRDEIFELLREYGKFSNATIGDTGKDLKTIMKEYMLTTEEYFTIGGGMYETLTDPTMGFKIYGGSTDPDHADNAGIFSNAEARQVSLSMNPSSISMMLRSDRDGDNDGFGDGYVASVNPTKEVSDGDYKSGKHYFLDLFLQNLKKINFDPGNARLEESLYDLIRFDLHGRDRKGDASAWSVAYVESLLFLSGVCQNTGWKDGGSNGEPATEPSDVHGHGDATEVLSFNDAIFSMGALLSCGKSVYDSAFPNNGRVYRSIVPFNRDNRGHYEFVYTSDYSIQSFLAGFSAGEMGLPDGGNPGGTPPAVNNYRPFTGDSIGDRSMTRWTYYNIVRACWHGEGPYYYAPSDVPSITANLDGSGAKTWYIYYRSNGLIYSYVYKANPADPSTWVYLYPADGHDSDDAATTVVSDGRGRNQRTNRFRHSWYSDYYMIKTKKFEGLGGFNPTNGSTDYYVVPSNDGVTNGINHGDGNVTTGRFLFHEILQPEDNNTRECASPEEALYRNYVWVMNEKKFVVILPLSLHAEMIGSHAYGAGFKIVEANGTVGLTSARRYYNDESRNHIWIQRGDAGNALGISTIPGDYRQSVLWYEGFTAGLIWTAGQRLGLSKVWESTLWGTSTPPVASHNAPAITRFAFPRFSLTMENIRYGGQNNQDVDFSVAMGSGPDWFQANDSDYNWNRRNGLMPVFVCLLSTIWDYQNRDFSIAQNREITLERYQRFAQNLVSFVAPRFYYIRDDSPSVSFMHKSWVPRIRGDAATAGDPHHVKMHRNSWDVSGAQGYGIDGVNDIISNPFAWFGGLDQRTFFQPEPMRTLINRLYDSDFRDLANGGNVDSRCDGMLALLTEYDVDDARGGDNEPKTRILTRAFNVLMNIAGPEFDDQAGLDYDDPNFDDTYEKWGARRKLFYALEQSATGQRGTKGNAAQLTEEKPPWGIIFPSWMFIEGVGSMDPLTGMYAEYTNCRDDEQLLDEGLLLSTGWDDDPTDGNDPDQGIGIAAIDEWDSADWSMFNLKLDMAAEMSRSGSMYNVTERLITIIEKMVRKINPTGDQIRSLVHTIGIVNAEWDTSTNMWVYPDELKTVKKIYNRRKLELSREDIHASSIFSREIAMAEGLVEYVLKTMDAPHDTEQLFSDLYRFLDDPLISVPDSELWEDIVSMTNGQTILMERFSQGEPADGFEDLGYQYNGPTTNIENIDYYGDWGEVFSK